MAIKLFIKQNAILFGINENLWDQSYIACGLNLPESKFLQSVVLHHPKKLLPIEVSYKWRILNKQFSFFNSSFRDRDLGPYEHSSLGYVHEAF